MSEWSPTCMDAEEYAGWVAASVISARHNPKDVSQRGVCRDCTLAFRNTAKARGECNSDERVLVAEDDDEVIPSADLVAQERRRSQWRALQARKRAGIRVRRTSEEIEDLRVQVLHLRLAGYTYEDIGRRFQINHTYARDLYLRSQR